MNKRIFLLLALIGAMAATTFAQGRKSLRINEVMVVNNNSAVDEYGLHPGWIELFNSNFAPLEISSVFLTTDRSNLEKPNKDKMYPVPLGDAKTHMGKRQHVVFWADAQPTKGTFHTNFRLIPGQDNWVAIYDANGKDLIDSVTVPATLLPGQTWAREQDGNGQWSLRGGDTTETLDYVTPGSANVVKGQNPKINNFQEKDANGFAMTLMAMCVVFSALLVLCLCFYGIGAIGKYFSRLNKARAHGVTVTEVAVDDHDSGEEIAAIVMALHEHLNAHDTESTILTINKVKRAYSPWSSKIYGLRSGR